MGGAAAGAPAQIMIKCSLCSCVSRIKASLGALQTAKLFVSEVIIPYLLRCKKPGFADLAAKLRMKSSKGFFCDNRRELRLLYHKFIARSAMGGAAAGAIAQIMIKCFHCSRTGGIKAPLGALQTASLFVCEVIIP